MSKKLQLEALLFQRKPLRLLLSLGGEAKYVNILAKQTDCTYSHVVKLLNKFEKLGLVNFEKLGRVKYVKLTEEGEKVYRTIEQVMKKFSSLK